MQPTKQEALWTDPRRCAITQRSRIRRMPSDEFRQFIIPSPRNVNSHDEALWMAKRFNHEGDERAMRIQRKKINRIPQKTCTPRRPPRRARPNCTRSACGRCTYRCCSVLQPGTTSVPDFLDAMESHKIPPAPKNAKSVQARVCGTHTRCRAVQSYSPRRSCHPYA